MNEIPNISPFLFKCIRKLDFESLLDKCGTYEGDALIKPSLPLLVRTSLITSMDTSSTWASQKATVLQIVSGMEVVNNIVALLSIDFQSLEGDVRQELRIRRKEYEISGSSQNESSSILISNLASGPALEFERSDATRRMRLVLSELLTIMTKHKMKLQQIPSELFDHPVFFSELCDVICIGMAELPHLLHTENVVPALLRLKYGGQFISRVVLNQPDCFNQVVCILIELGSSHTENSDTNSVDFNVQDTLLTLADLDACHLSIQNQCLKALKLPSVVLTLDRSVSDRRSTVSFVNSLLLCNRDLSMRHWFCQYIRSAVSSSNTSAFSLFRQSLVDEIMKQSVVEKSFIDFIKFYASLKLIVGVNKMWDSEYTAIIHLVTKCAELSSVNMSSSFFAISVFSLSLVCTNLLTSTRDILAYFKLVMKSEEGGDTSAFSNFALIITIQFQNQNYSSISQMINRVLLEADAGQIVKVISSSSLAKVRNIFLSSADCLYTEFEIAVESLQQFNFKSTKDNDFPVISDFQTEGWVLSMLKNGTYSKHKLMVEVRNYLAEKLLIEAVDKASFNSQKWDETIVSLIGVYVSAIYKEFDSSSLSKQQPNGTVVSEFRTHFLIQEQKLCQRFHDIFTDEGGSSDGFIKSAILCAYYVLLVQDKFGICKGSIKHRKSFSIYSAHLTNVMPIKFLLKQVSVYFPSSPLNGAMWRLCSNHYPHLCLLTQDWMFPDLQTVHDVEHTYLKKTVGKVEITVNQFQEAMEQIGSDSSKSIEMLERLLRVNTPHIWKFAPVTVSFILDVVKRDTPRRLKDVYKEFWFKLNELRPRMLWRMTCDQLGNCSVKSRLFVVSNDDSSCDITPLLLDPLKVLSLRAGEEVNDGAVLSSPVFRCAPIMEVVIYMLQATLKGSRMHLVQYKDVISSTTAENEGANSSYRRDELRNAIVATQESAAIQILLDSITTPPSTSESVLSDLKEVQCLIFTYMHRAFLEDPNLAKLVHFQTYDTSILSEVVRGVPSMHICLDFIPELLTSPSASIQIFAITLTSQLVSQYALAKAYPLARLCLNVMTTMLSSLTHDQKSLYFAPLLPTLPRFCAVFPPLIEETVLFLMSFARSQHAMLSCSYSSQAKLSLQLRALQKSDGRDCYIEGDGWVHKNNVDHEKLLIKCFDTFSCIASNVVSFNNVY